MCARRSRRARVVGTATAEALLFRGVLFRVFEAQAGLLGIQRPGHAAPGVWTTQLTGSLNGGARGPECSVVAVALCLVTASVLLATTASRHGHRVAGESA
jgi:hypothetical protein